jgi:hypothetical protein
VLQLKHDHDFGSYDSDLGVCTRIGPVEQEVLTSLDDGRNGRSPSVGLYAPPLPLPSPSTRRSEQRVPVVVIPSPTIHAPVQSRTQRSPALTRAAERGV